LWWRVVVRVVDTAVVVAQVDSVLELGCLQPPEPITRSQLVVVVVAVQDHCR
jgi:hypothetical protein